MLLPCCLMRPCHMAPQGEMMMMHAMILPRILPFTIFDFSNNNGTHTFSNSNAWEFNPGGVKSSNMSKQFVNLWQVAWFVWIISQNGLHQNCELAKDAWDQTLRTEQARERVNTYRMVQFREIKSIKPDVQQATPTWLTSRLVAQQPLPYTAA